VPGYASTISLMLFMGGIELIGIGVVGEYIGRIYYESKERPVYLVRRRYQAKSKVSVLPTVRHDARAPHLARVELMRRRTAPRVRVAGH